MYRTITPFVALLLCIGPILGQGTKDDYERAARLRERLRGKASGLTLTPRWQADGKLWYRVGNDYAVVDTRNGRKTLQKELPGATTNLAPRHPAELPRSISGGAASRITLENKTSALVKVFWLDTEGGRKEYGTIAPGKEWSSGTYAGHVWLVTKEDETPLVGFVAEEDVVRGQIDGTTPERRQRRRGGDPTLSPDGKWRVRFEGSNATLLATAGGDPVSLTKDGTPENYYEGPVTWSPDSRYFTVNRTVPGQGRKIPIVTSAPRDQTQPKWRLVPYDKPGDKLAISRPHLFEAAAKTEVALPALESVTPNPFNLEDPQWTPDSSRFYLRYNERGHQVYRVLEVMPKTGASRILIEERVKTFIDWTNKVYFQPLYSRKEALWMSERDGWNHLYVCDLATGQVKRQLTKGEWVVRGIEKLDEDRKEIILRVGGLIPGQDPYHVHYVKVSLDSGKLTPLTEGDGTHTARFSPDGQFFVDSYSRVDSAPVHELRRTSDGKKVLTLETADLAAWQAAGGKAPERFVAKGRDGKTDIYGLIFRPTNFDSTKTYPIIENIYAGPHGQHVPKSFTEVFGSQEMAELGFIVVQIDGMGTNWRSKAFHDVCWKNIADAGFPDRIAWLKSAAAKYSELDINRVGIYGTSAGGQNALHGLLLHGDFYKAGVADCGCVDNRMDKVWWNEQWMGWPIDKHYAEQSCVILAPKLTGKLFLMVGEEDTNVDPSSTLQVVDALIRADKDFEFLMAPNVGHGVLGLPYARRRMQDFFVKNLMGVEPRR